MSVRLLPGDCLHVLRTLEPESVSACVTDPPYHLTSIVKRFGGENAAPAKFGTDGAYARASKGFMSKTWDGGDVAFRPETWRLVFDVMKPGAYLVAFASTRGYHRMVCAIEDAGLIIHPMIGWIFGSGFPKAKRLECEGADGWRYGLQALKPALEPICLAQKPMIGTGTANWLAHGTGALNIDACRIGFSDEAEKTERLEWSRRYGGAKYADNNEVLGTGLGQCGSLSAKGRWPANVLHDGSEEVEAAFAAFGPTPGQQGDLTGHARNRPTKTCFGDMGPAVDHMKRGDSGTASRFFYSAKADKGDRADSRHPTVKPVDLMRWLVRLITPPGGTVMDPFAGSGTTGEAAMLEGFDCILIERDPQSVADIQHRIKRWSGVDAPLFASAAE